MVHSQASHHCCCDSQPGQSAAVVVLCLRGGGQMGEVITRIIEHEGGATDRCHHWANSWRQKPLQQLGDYICAQAHIKHAQSPQKLPSLVLERGKQSLG